MALLHPLFLLIFMTHTLTEAAYYNCSGSFSNGSGYQTVRDTFLYDMPADVPNQGGYHHYSTSELYCLGLCRKDIIVSNTDACDTCIKDSVSQIFNNCRYSKQVIAWGEDAGCVIRCSTHEFQPTYESTPLKHVCNSSNVGSNYVTLFGHVLGNLTRNVAEKAGDEGSLSSFSSGVGNPVYFAAEESKVGDFVTVYALGFCIPTLSQSACTGCLLEAGNVSERVCNGKQGATIFTPSCVFRYELYRFYELSSPVAVSPPPQSPPASDVRKEGGSSRKLVTSIVLPIIFVLIVIAFATYMKKRKQKGADEDYAIGEDNTDSCLEFSLNTIQIATNYFSTDNKLGQGGFGAVYKGRLPNGKQIAAKRLVFRSGREEEEFKNEVRLVAKLHHKNLIRLLGFCLQGKERILIYELALNGSLDRFIFDEMRRQHLTWRIRFNIIEGIARGILYLHEDSQLTIIHRDLKPGNILLDESMTPKISDFGTARLFIEDQSSASKIVGTFGYMSPEYVKYGKISIKVDVFSFGVLLLEIVCGKRNNASGDHKHLDHLLSKTWKYWKTGAILNMMDPILSMASGQIVDIIRCINIGLLCVQEDATQRPTMNSVILMLEGRSQSLPPPLKPAYFMDVEEDDDDEKNLPMMGTLDFSMSQPTELSGLDPYSGHQTTTSFLSSR